MNDEVTPQELAKTLPVPAVWAATFGIDPKTYWRDNAQLLPCERDEMQDVADYIVAVDAQLTQEYEDEEIPDDLRFTLPGYDPDDFTEGR